MNDILEPPVEQDFPSDRADRIRAGIFAAIHQPRHRHVGGRVAVVAVVAVVVGVGVAVTALRPSGSGGDHVRALAMSEAELSPELRGVAERCLTWYPQQQRSAGLVQIPVSMRDLSVATQRGRDTAIMFVTDAGYVTCDVSALSIEPGEEITGSTASDEWRLTRDWLPGPVQRLDASSSESNGGDVTVMGRVSPRVHKLRLDHGDGHTTAAQVRDGMFGLVSDGVRVRENAELVSLDAEGNEIDRRPLFQPNASDRCYVNPAGTIVYDVFRPNRLPHATSSIPVAPPSKPEDCLPAEPWRR